LNEIAALNRFGDRMSIQPVGIGDKNHTVEMLVDPAGGFVQTERFEHTMWAEPVPIQVSIETIGAAAARLGVIPTLIKMDIEGYEYEAISGALDFLRRHRPKLLLELHLNYLEQRKCPAKQLVKALADCGYSFSSYTGRKLQLRDVYDCPFSSIHVVVEAN
jgi:FkbM family methyltransferase